MKKLLSCVLALSFCTANAGLWSNIKSKAKSTVSKVVGSVKNTAKSEITKVYNQQKTQLSNQYLVPQQISNSLQSMISETDSIVQANMNKEPVYTVAKNLYTLLLNCFSNISRTIVDIDQIKQYVDQLVSNGVQSESLQKNCEALENQISSYKNTYDTTLNSMLNQIANLKIQSLEVVNTKIQTLENQISSYKSTYDTTLNSMINQIANLKIQTNDENRLKIIEELDQLLQECRTDAVKISQNYAQTYNHINYLSDDVLKQGFFNLVNLANSIQTANTNVAALSGLKATDGGVASTVLNNVSSEVQSSSTNATVNTAVSSNISSGVQTEASSEENKLKVIEELNRLLQECRTDTIKISQNYAQIYNDINYLSDNVLTEGFSTLVNLVNSMQTASTNAAALSGLKTAGGGVVSTILNNASSEVQSSAVDIMENTAVSSNVPTGIQSSTVNTTGSVTNTGGY